jgi:peroxiredoxin
MMANLEYGKLSPQFSLESIDGQTYTRGEFRNKSGLVLIFFEPTHEVHAFLRAVCDDEAEYQELNSRILGIGHADKKQLAEMAAPLINLCFTLLADPDGEVWNAYSGLDAPGYGVVVLDLYGGVDAQKMVDHVSALPEAKTILAWTRAAQYKCNI